MILMYGLSVNIKKKGEKDLGSFCSLQEYKEYLDSRCKEIVDWYNLMRKLKGGNA